ncbi:MAG: type II secretion system F family protein [Trichloromonadaceae bacterium]
MPSFSCKVGTSDGRVLEKEFEAASAEILRENLEGQGFFVFQVRRRPLAFLFSKEASSARLSGRRFLSFNQEFLVLIRSGLPILQVMDTITERMEAGPLLEVLRDIRNEVKGGSMLSEAFAKFPRIFPHLYIASVRAGEKTGDLPVTLARYLVYQKRQEALKAKIKGASFYPVLLTIAVLVVLAFMLLYVVPSFTQIYADANAQLPLLTRILIGISTGMVSWLPLLLPALIVAIAGARLYALSGPGVLQIDRLKLKIPFFGPLFLDYALSGFCRTFGTTLASGIPAVQAMQMSRGTLNNRVLEEAMVRAVQRVEEGTTISAAIEQTGYFPVIALRMIGVGEASGALAEMLADVAEYYEEEVERRLDRLTTLIEPIMMLAMGLLIGGIVVAMYIPIFQMGATVR